MCVRPLCFVWNKKKGKEEKVTSGETAWPTELDAGRLGRREVSQSSDKHQGFFTHLLWLCFSKFEGKHGQASSLSRQCAQALTLLTAPPLSHPTGRKGFCFSWIAKSPLPPPLLLTIIHHHRPSFSLLPSKAPIRPQPTLPSHSPLHCTPTQSTHHEGHSKYVAGRPRRDGVGGSLCDVSQLDLPTAHDWLRGLLLPGLPALLHCKY